MPAYYLHIDNQIQGPYSEAEVKTRFDAGVLQPDTQVCVDGGEWGQLADTLTHLFPPPARPIAVSRSSAASAASSINPYQPPEGPIAASSDLPAKTYEGIGRSGFLWSSIGLAVLGGILLSAAKGSDITALVIVSITAGLMLIPASSRLKNIGMNPGWCFLLLVPLLGLFVIVLCILVPAGYQGHRKLDLQAKIIGGAILASIAVLIWEFTQM